MNKENFIKEIKTINANKKSLREFVKEKYVNENGEAVIEIYGDSSSIFNSFSNPESPELSQELLDYIDDQVRYIPIDYPLILSLKTPDLKIDKDRVEKKLHDVYRLRLADKNDDLKRNAIISVLLAIFGLAFLSIFFTLQYIPTVNVLFDEIFSIIGTFLLWESIDYSVLNRSIIKIEKINIAHSALIKIK